ncbi:MAG: two-component regulator propeller domain-containing protein [Ignavibacteriaceae bacterium]
MKEKIFIIILFLSSIVSILPQKQELKFDHFSFSEGLSQSTVQTILQDTDGFLWIGSRDGLNRFDGYKFYTYQFDEEDSNSISDNFIRTLFEDRDRNIWIGTNKGLNKFTIEKKAGSPFIEQCSCKSFKRGFNLIKSISADQISSFNSKSQERITQNQFC